MRLATACRNVERVLWRLHRQRRYSDGRLRIVAGGGRGLQVRGKKFFQKSCQGESQLLIYVYADKRI